MKNTNKVLEFFKSLFLPRKMAKHMNMPFLLSLLLLVAAACLNIVTSNTRAAKDAEDLLQFPSLYEQFPEDFLLKEMTTGEVLPHISIQKSDKLMVDVIIDGKKQQVQGPSTYLKSDKDGVYHGTHETSGGIIDLTIVIADNVYTSYGTVKEPVTVPHFDLEGYMQQKPKENTQYYLYVLTLENLYYQFGLEQIKDGKSTKAVSNSLLFETKDNGELKYFIPASEDELVLNAYGDFDSTKWTKEASSGDQINFEASKAHFESLNTDQINYDQYVNMVQRITPKYRHLKNISNALYGGAMSYTNLENYGCKVEELNKSMTSFQNGLKQAMVVFNANLLKTMSLIVSFAITMFFPLFLSFVTWLLSKGFYMHKFKQYYAICALCFAMTSILAIIGGFFVSYTEMSFALLVIGSVYYIVATLRINTIKEDDDNTDQSNKAEQKKEPIKYSKVSSDTSYIG